MNTDADLKKVNTILTKYNQEHLLQFYNELTDEQKEQIRENIGVTNNNNNLPLGHHYAWPFSTIPANSIQCNGAEYSRTLYADFWQWLQDNSLAKTETEWQSIASANGGYCPWYSSGDGSTTFRTPKFAPFIQVAIASGNVGKYHQAGLPNITGSVSVSGGENDLSRTAGTFVNSGALTASSTATTTLAGYENVSGRYWSKLSISASNSDKTYGRSSTVQPESSEWMICVVVFGIATNVGSTDVGNVMSAVAQVQAELPNKLGNTTPHIVNTWKSGSGWYRVWSDGFIEQGGVATVGNSKYAPVAFPHPFSNTYYSISGYIDENATNSSVIVAKVTYNPVRTNTSCGLAVTWSGGGGSGYLPKGYKVYWSAVGY